ncbi:SusE domain-containing protein [Aquimarina sp. I32.4]|uniref:SusE domain-containing protein n=1 Tax=Aquimarina sp. I32.4 TaxID=2053903 RepID=UPI000CDEDEBD|nr:SusE domain-containing protein [Aquimarina sp. I32.4]
MKKISILMFVFATMLCFNACVEDEDPTFVIQENQTEGPLIVTANSTVNLIKELEDEQVFTLVWEDATYNINTPITYTIEAGLGGTNFETTLENPVIATTTDRFYKWTIKELNNLAIGLGIEPEKEGAIELRIISSIGSNGGQAILSNNVTALTLTPYASILAVKNLFFVGNAVDTNKDGLANNDDWNNGEAISAKNTYLFRDPDNENIFHFRGFFGFTAAAGLDPALNEFKVLEQQGAWQPQWGTNDGATLSVNTGDTSDPGPFTTTASGYYDFTMNLDDLSFSLTPIDITGATEYTTIGYIGSSRTGNDDGWGGDDTDMIQSPFNPHIWYIEGQSLFDGVLKFRHSNDWPGNWGGTTEFTGIGITDGDPPGIPVTQGTYDIWFNDLDGRYLLVPVE